MNNPADNEMAMGNVQAVQQQAYSNPSASQTNVESNKAVSQQQTYSDAKIIQQVVNDNNTNMQVQENNFSLQNPGNIQLISGNEQSSAYGGSGNSLNLASFSMPQMKFRTGSSSSGAHARTQSLDHLVHHFIRHEAYLLNKHKPRRKKPVINVAGCWKP